MAGFKLIYEAEILASDAFESEEESDIVFLNLEGEMRVRLHPLNFSTRVHYKSWLNLVLTYVGAALTHCLGRCRGSVASCSFAAERCAYECGWTPFEELLSNVPLSSFVHRGYFGNMDSYVCSFDNNWNAFISDSISDPDWGVMYLQNMKCSG